MRSRWPALALACGLPLDHQGLHSQSLPTVEAGGPCWRPVAEVLFVLSVLSAIRRRLIGARDLIIDSAPILAWRRKDPDAAIGHAPAQHPRPLLQGTRMHTLLYRGSGLLVFFLLSPANVHDAPFARPRLQWAVRLNAIRARIIRLDAAYWGLRLIAWIHASLHAVAVIRLPPQATAEPLLFASHLDHRRTRERSSIERFFGRVFLFFHEAQPTSVWLVGHRATGRASPPSPPSGWVWRPSLPVVLT